MKNIINTLIAATIALSTSNVLAQEYFYRINSKIVVNSNTTTPETPETPTTPDPEPAFDCFDPANVDQIGTAGECNGKLIVDNNLLRDLVASNGNYGSDAIFTGQVSDMSGLFQGRNVNLNIADWNTSNVYTMSNMFRYSPFNVDISNWNVSNVVFFDGMFEYAEGFNFPLSNWNTSNAINMSRMFFSATSFNQPIGNWNVSNVSLMNSMFYGAASFNRDISSWCVINIASRPTNFANFSAYPFQENFDGFQPIWGTCP